MLIFVLSWIIRSYDPRSDVASESPPNQVTGVTLAYGSFEMTMHHVPTWSGSTIYMENPLPEEARSDVGLWSMLCQLSAATPKSEFSASLLLPLEAMGCSTSVLTFENECSPRPSKRRMEYGNGCYSAHGLYPILGWDRLHDMFSTDCCLQYIFLTV